MQPLNASLVLAFFNWEEKMTEKKSVRGIKINRMKRLRKERCFFANGSSVLGGVIQKNAGLN